MKKLLLLSGLMIVISASPATALNFAIYNTKTQGSEITSWIAGLGGQVNILEDFEGISLDGTMGWHQSLSTGVGRFTASGSAGTGGTSFNGINNPGSDSPHFSIQDREKSWYGRKNTTSSGSQWLDSGDITELSLTGIDSSLTNLFFYLQDPSDAGARTTIEAGEFGEESISQGQTNGSSYFVGITLAKNESLSQLSWTTTHTNDGYGLDDFSTVVTPVPEPATVLLFFTGIAGLAAVRRKRKQ